jgi:hypothetical protein
VQFSVITVQFFVITVQFFVITVQFSVITLQKSVTNWSDWWENNAMIKSTNKSIKVIAYRYSTIIYWTKFPWVSIYRQPKNVCWTFLPSRVALGRASNLLCLLLYDKVKDGKSFNGNLLQRLLEYEYFANYKQKQYKMYII